MELPVPVPMEIVSPGPPLKAILLPASLCVPPIVLLYCVSDRNTLLSIW